MKKLGLILLLFWAVRGSAAIRTSEIESWEGRPIGPFLSTWHPEADLADPEPLVRGQYDQKFTPSTRDYPSVGFSHPEFWAKLVIENDSSERKIFWLESQYIVIDDITLYSIDEQGAVKVQRHGDRVREELKDHIVRGQGWRLDLKPGANTFYLRSKTEGANVFALFLWGPAAFDRHRLYDALAVGAMVGTLIALLIYNAFIGISFRSKTYLLYTLFLATMVLTQFSLQGLWLLWGVKGANTLMNNGFLIFANLTNFLGVIVTRYFLNMDEHMPRMNRVILAVACIPLCIIVVGQFSSYFFFGKISTAFIAGGSVFLLGCSLYSIRCGYRPARYYLAAWAFILSANILTAMHFEGVYHSQLVVQFNILPGAVCEGVLMSLALAERVNDMRERSDRTIREQEATNLALAHKNAEQESILRLEVESKLSLASDMAHRLNNPLNYIQIGLSNLDRKEEDLNQMTQVIFAQADSDDPEVVALQKFFADHKQDMETICSSMQLGLKRAIESIADIRGISGVDGHSIRSFDPSMLFAEIMQSLELDLNPGDYLRLKFEPLSLKVSSLQSDPLLLRNALKSFIFDVARATGDKVTIVWVERGENGCELTLTLAPGPYDRRAVELSAQKMSRLLTSSLLEATLVVEPLQLRVRLVPLSHQKATPVLAS